MNRTTVPALAASALLIGGAFALASIDRGGETMRSVAHAAASQQGRPAPIDTREVVYTHERTVYRGYMAKPRGIESREEPVPGVLVVHEWWGRNDFAMRTADELARRGYVAFALDMIGEATVVESAGEAQAQVAPLYQDRGAMRAIAKAGLEQLAGEPGVDASDLAAIGFCFGGTVALELARSGADLDAAVSFHGGLGTTSPMAEGTFDGTIMVANGAVDPFVPDQERVGFRGEMEGADVDYFFVEYGGAVHSFTNPGADDYDIDGVAYDETARRRSFDHMYLLFDHAFRD